MAEVEEDEGGFGLQTGSTRKWNQDESIGMQENPKSGIRSSRSKSKNSYTTLLIDGIGKQNANERDVEQFFGVFGDIKRVRMCASSSLYLLFHSRIL